MSDWSAWKEAGKTEKLGRSKRNYVAYGSAFFLLAAAIYLECCVTMAYICNVI